MICALHASRFTPHAVTTLLAVLTICCSFSWLWPATRRWLRPSPEEETLALAAGFGFSVGALSLYMLALGLLPGRWLRPTVVLPLPWLGLAYEFWRHQRVPRPLSPPPPLSLSRLLPTSPLARWLLLVCLGGLLVILVNTVSYPFYRYDVLARFAPNARQLFETGAVPGTLAGYPLEVQLLYSFAFMAGGAVNDHLAGIYVAAFAAALVLVTFATGRALFSARTGWIAALLLLSSPLFVDWATSGYVDVPSGVYHGLTLLLAWHWMVHGEKRYAIGAGLMAGLALWTKQSALVLLPALAVVPLLRGWPMRDFRAQARNGLSALGAALALAGPWYLRNVFVSGPNGVIPAPGAFDAQSVDHSLNALFTFVGDRAEWGPWLSVTALAGVVLLAVEAVRGLRITERQLVSTGSPATAHQHVRTVLLLCAFVLPYHLIWWRGFSYQTRYLLISAPMYAVVAGYAVDWMAGRIPAATQAPHWLIIAAAAGLVLFGASGRLGAVYHLLVEPLQNDDAKLARLSPELWPLAQHIRAEIAPGSRLLVMDGALAYWLYGDYELRQGYPTSLDELREYDYLVTAPFGDSVYQFFGESENEVLRALGDPAVLREIYQHPDGAAIYKVVGGTP